MSAKPNKKKQKVRGPKFSKQLKMRRWRKTEIFGTFTELLQTLMMNQFVFLQLLLVPDKNIRF